MQLAVCNSRYAAKNLVLLGVNWTLTREKTFFQRICIQKAAWKFFSYDKTLVDLLIQGERALKAV